MGLKKLMCALSCAGAGALFLAGVGQAQTVADGTFNYEGADQGLSNLVELQAELDAAKPLPVPVVEMPADGIVSVGTEKSAEAQAAPPGYVPGWIPGTGPQPDPTVGYTIDENSPLYGLATGQVSEGVYGSAPTNPLSGPYPPYQRWTWFGRYTTYPTSMVGKLYFDTDGNGSRDAFCTASVVSSRVIATAGHCISDGAGGWYSSFLFCPSYNASGINPAVGCWGWSYANTTNGYFSSSQADRDYGCIVTASTGTVHATTVGTQTGWAGRAWNWASQQPTVVLGYPANDSFPGYHIIIGTSPEWYEVNMTSGDGQVSRYIGGDQHSGNSGGPWYLNWSHRSAEWATVDSDAVTDPLSPSSNGASAPYLNGVYSHKRCTGGSCASPPTASAGLFWNEMGAAEFNNTVGDAGEFEDVLATCFAND